MKVLSWDVGVKNLAGCILEFEPPEKKKSKSEKQKAKDNIKVEDISYPFWGVINLLEEDETEQVCMAVKATKFTKSNPIPQPVICGKKAKQMIEKCFLFFIPHELKTWKDGKTSAEAVRRELGQQHVNSSVCEVVQCLILTLMSSS